MLSFRKSNYTPERNAELTIETLAVLVETAQVLTIDEIKNNSIVLASVTSQKMSRILSELIEKGFVVKTPSKAKGKMVYGAVSALQEQGYNMNSFIC